MDRRGAVSPWSSGINVASDGRFYRAPVTPAPVNLEVPARQSVPFGLQTTDPDGDDLRYDVDWGDYFTSLTPFVRSGESTTVDHSFRRRGSYRVRIRAQDVRGSASNWSEAGIITVQNSPPQTPAAPVGPSSGFRNTPYSYSASFVEFDGDAMDWVIDWGDGTTTTGRSSAVVGSTSPASITVLASHSWSKPDTYLVRARATDSLGAQSAWSAPLSVTIANLAPLAPTTPEGPSLGHHDRKKHPHRLYTYTASSVDPEGDGVRLVFDWGDGSTTSTAQVASGVPVSAAHRWRRKGVYNVRVRAVDVFGGQSPPSPVRRVIIK